MPNKLTDEQSRTQIKVLIQSLQQRLIDKFDGIEQTTLQRLLRIYDVWRQVNLRRITDLADGAICFFEQGRLVPACTLTRSVFETVGVQYYIYKKMLAHTENTDPESIHKLLLSAVFGRRDKEWPEIAIQALTALDHLNKQYPGFRDEYDRLCEYAHPNLAGGYGLYVRTEGARLESSFGNNPWCLDMEPWGQGALRLILIVANEVDRLLCLIHPQFVSMAEAHAPDTLHDQ
jgi:hypothetical protein